MGFFPDVRTIEMRTEWDMRKNKRIGLGLGFCFLAGLAATGADAQSAGTQELSKSLSNPISSLISVPFVLDYDEGLGPNGDGHATVLKLQPVVPFSIAEDWNLISRTIIPFIDQDDVIPNASQSGVGDVVQSFFFSPKAPSQGGWIWGAGPVFLLPTASDDALGFDQFAAGITGVALQQSGPWTYGALANHLWGVGNNSDNPSVNASFLQPFVSYTTEDSWTFSLQAEATYTWQSKQWAVPINGIVSKIVTIGDQPLSVGGGVRYWAVSPDGGAEDWGARLNVTFLFPK
jgi:hypothetical protein